MSPEYLSFAKYWQKHIKWGFRQSSQRRWGIAQVADMSCQPPGRASASLQLLQERCQDVWGRAESSWFLCQIGCQVTMPPGTCHFRMFVNHTASLATRLTIQDSRNADYVNISGCCSYKHSYNMLQTYSHTGFLASHIVCIQSVRCNLCLRRPHVSLSVWKNDYGFWMFLTQPLHPAKFSLFVQEQQCYIFRLLLGQLNCSRERESFGKRGVKPDIFWPSLTSNCCCHLHDSHWVKLPLSHPYIVSGWVHIQSCFVMFLQDMLRKNRPSQLSEIIAAGFVTNTVCDGRWTVTICYQYL